MMYPVTDLPVLFLQCFPSFTLVRFMFCLASVHIHLKLNVYAIETLMQTSFRKTIKYTKEINANSAGDAWDNQCYEIDVNREHTSI